MENKYDDSGKGGYSYEEKLAMVANEQMAPEEIGVASADEAKLKLVGEQPPKVVFGTSLLFRAGAVPLELRAEWAYQETKIAMSPTDKDNFKHEFMEAHKHEFPIQGELLCGSAQARFGQTFKDPVLGLCQMLRQAADMLEAKYTEPEETPQADTPTQQDEPTPAQDA